MLITVLGPDGTGKTTLAKELAFRFDGLEYIYFGYNRENRSYKYFGNFIKSDVSNFFLKALRRILVLLNDLYYFRLAKKRNIISDRCPIDNYVATEILGNKLSHLYYNLVSKVFPNPDFVFLLEGDANIIFERKKENSVELIESMIANYIKYLDSRGIKYGRIDTVKNDKEQTIEKASEIIHKVLV